MPRAINGDIADIWLPNIKAPFIVWGLYVRIMKAVGYYFSLFKKPFIVYRRPNGRGSTEVIYDIFECDSAENQL